jgi:hypothetical protein
MLKLDTQIIAKDQALAAIPADTTRTSLIARRTRLLSEKASLTAVKGHYQALVTELNVAATAEQLIQRQQAAAPQKARLAAAGANAADLATFDGLVTKNVNAETLNTYEQAVVSPRSFDLWSGTLSQDIKSAYKQLADTNTRKEVIEAYTNIVKNGVDGVAGLETNSQHETTRMVFLVMATRSTGLADLRNTSVATLTKMTKFYDDTTKGSWNGTQWVGRPVAYEALGPYENNGLSIVLKDPNRSEAKINQYIDYAYANPRLNQAQYDTYARSIVA